MKKKPTFVDLFAGAGGFGLGFRLAGYSLSCALEIDHWAACTLRENQEPDALVIEDDIRSFKDNREILLACGNNKPDVIIGGPPCQGFSVAGPASKRDPHDPRNSLFRDYARWVACLSPKVFVMENVKGILSRQNSQQEMVIDIIKREFLDIGYTVEIWKLNAANFGVPQFRERVFIVGNLDEVEIGQPDPIHRIPKQKLFCLEGIERELKRPITVWDALSDLPEIRASEGADVLEYTQNPKTGYQAWARGEEELLYNHEAMKHTPRMIGRFKQIKWGQSVIDVPREHRARKRNGNGEISQVVYNSNNRRLNPYSLSYTIPAQFYSSFIHPYQHRNITAREAARLQSFPDSYRFMGKRTMISQSLLRKYGRDCANYLSQYNQIGNAVPPLLAKAIAEHIRPFFA